MDDEYFSRELKIKVKIMRKVLVGKTTYIPPLNPLVEPTRSFSTRDFISKPHDLNHSDDRNATVFRASSLADKKGGLNPLAQARPLAPAKGLDLFLTSSNIRTFANESAY